MKEIRMTDAHAKELIFILKELVKPVAKTLVNGDAGCIRIRSQDKEFDFFLDYKYEKRKKVLNFRESFYNNYSLIRITLSKGFHKNADNKKIYGNRINIFSEDEYYLKADGRTHMRAYKLPFKRFKDSDDFIEQLYDLLDYTKTNRDDLSFSIQRSLI